MADAGGPCGPPSRCPDASALDAGELDAGCEDEVTCAELAVWIARVGDGEAAISAQRAAPVFIEHRRLDGSLVQTLALPTSTSGTRQPLTLKGTDGVDGAGVLEGALARSTDRGVVTLGGFGARVGEQVVDTAAGEVPRVVAQIDAEGAIDTSTRLTAAFSGGESGGVRAAVKTGDRDAVWVSGTGDGGTGGIHTMPLGSSGASTQLVSEPNNVRWLHIAGGQLYGSAAGRLFTVGDGLPRSGSPAAEDIPGIEVTSPSGFAVLDRRVAVAGPDTIYVAEVDGIRRFEIEGGEWTLTATFDGDAGIGARGLAVAELDASVVIFAVTSEADPDTGAPAPRVIAYIDDRSTDSPEPLEIAPHTPLTLYRGIALAPR